MVIRFIEMFGGIGSFRLGLERINLEKANKEGGKHLSQQRRSGSDSFGDGDLSDCETRQKGRKSRNALGCVGLEKANKELRNRLQGEDTRRGVSDPACGKLRQESARGFSGKNSDGNNGLEKASGGRADSHLDSKQSTEEGWRQDSKRVSSNFRREDGNGRGKHSFCCVWANDWEEADVTWVKDEKGNLKRKGSKNLSGKIYRKHWDDGTYVDADIKTINADSIPDFDLLTAGFPCQSFSVAGKRKGFEDTRGTLFYEILRVAKAKRPKLLLLENVRGLLSIDRGQTFKTILQELGNIGYWVEWQILNSKHYGVPQNRERVFIVAHLAESCGREVFPIGESSQKSDRAPVEARSKGTWIQDEPFVSNTISQRDYKGGNKLVAGVLRSPLRDDNLVAIGVTLANVSRYNQGVNRTPLKQDNSSFALNSAGDQGVLKDLRIRRLTPTECERLQSFPDGWTKFGLAETQGEADKANRRHVSAAVRSKFPKGNPFYGPILRKFWERGMKTLDPCVFHVADTQRYKTLGNAITVSVVSFLGRRILESLRKN